MFSLDRIEDYITLIILLSTWVVAVKGFALWTAARRKEKGWFIALLIINTLGVLEVLYLLVTRRKDTAQKKPVKTAFEHLVEQEQTLTSRQQAILHILTGVLDAKQQAIVSNTALHRAVASIEDRIAGTISQKQLRIILDKPESEGGIGLYRQTADHIAEHVEAMIVAMKHQKA